MDTPQSSNKAGVKSSSRKAETSRYGEAAPPSIHPVGGAFGKEEAHPHRVDGTASHRPGKAAAIRGRHMDENPVKRGRK